ncbi:MAG TPA: hypothetical protein PK287_11360 [Tenuifilaceae bacterium]|jgi:hypothetical protein|nr:hypothetical protein [Tenuifilaceae bacterium]HPK78445.1 hypothetical protein [Tenuifilaceae bacterium]HQI59171.1 hypothetical protein [Tenuifilaceae bacterium]HQK65114.1 hypothetical protein [Tenuifilaceae bacterium]HRS46423.1 hypothetical protein [Tenuifilaceae bacterium]
MGVVSAILKFGGINFVNPEWFASNAAQILGLGMFLVICAYLALESLRGKPDAE